MRGISGTEFVFIFLVNSSDEICLIKGLITPAKFFETGKMRGISETEFVLISS